MKRSIFVIFPTLLSIMLSLNFFWIKPLIPGFDSPFYLSEIRSFSRRPPSPFDYTYTNRYLTIAVPGIITNVFKTDPVTSYRIVITATYISIAIALYCLIKNITKNKLVSSAIASAMVISPFLITYSTMLYANFASFLIVFVFFAIESGKDVRGKNILLGLIYGSIFYVHNFFSVAISLIMIAYFLIFALIKKDTKILFNGALIMLTGLSVGCITFGQYIGINQFIILAFSLVLITVFEIISLRPKLLCKRNITIVTSLLVILIAAQIIYNKPVFSKLFNDISHFGKTFQPVLLGNETQRIADSLKEHSGKFWLYFFPLFAPISLFFSRKELCKNKKQFLLPLAIFIPSLILTFQPLYHLNFLPERFVSLVVLSTYFFYVAIISLPFFKKYLIPLAVLPLFLNYIASDSLILNKGYRSFSSEEIQIYQEVKPLIAKDSVVMLSSNHEYWSRYFLEGIQVVTGDSHVSCGTVKEVGYFGEANFTLAKLLGETDSQKGTALVIKLKSLFPDKKIYILADNGLSCGNGKILQEITLTKELLHKNNWYLYEIL